MINFSYDDISNINKIYKNILVNLKEYLKQYSLQDELEYSKIVINMMHEGLFSMDKNIQFENEYDYIALPSTISLGVHVTYGICCCRHATGFVYDLLCLLKYNPSLLFIFVDNQSGLWRIVNPVTEKFNHRVILTANEQYLIDPANKFLLQKESNGDLHPLAMETPYDFSSYQEPQVSELGQIITKYYKCRELGIKNVY